jgi:hypothetical protein
MSDEGVSVGELSRQVRDVLLRFQGLAERLDNTYVSKEFFALYQSLVDKSLKALEDAVAKAAVAEALKTIETDKVDKTSFDELKKRVDAFEDDKKWLIRLVATFIILGVLGAVFVASGPPK